MPATVTLHIFSGRPNPSWILEDAAVTEFRNRLYRKPTAISAAPPGSLHGLGYRGLEIRTDDADLIHVHGGVASVGVASPNLLDDGREVERFVLGTMPQAGPAAITARVLAAMRVDIDRDLAARFDLSKYIKIDPIVINGCPANVGALAPPWEPVMWNFSPTQGGNNCYNYANDRVTNTFAQPGKYHGAQYTALTCPSVQTAAVADSLVTAPNFTTPVPNGWYVALVIWPNVDFHWYRQDIGGCWSHKPGSTPAVNVDASGNPITDPVTANRGPYTQFCSYMITRPGIVRIK